MINNAAEKREWNLDGFTGTLWIYIVRLRETLTTVALERHLLGPADCGNRATYDKLMYAPFIAIAILYPGRYSGDIWLIWLLGGISENRSLTVAALLARLKIQGRKTSGLWAGWQAKASPTSGSEFFMEFCGSKAHSNRP